MMPRTIDPKDLQIEEFVIRKSWTGATTGIRIRHVPSGIEATASEDRSSHRNRAIAIERLNQKLATYPHDPNCPECHGTGVRDSGGVHPWGEPANIPCWCNPVPPAEWDELAMRISQEFIPENTPHVAQRRAQLHIQIIDAMWLAKRS